MDEVFIRDATGPSLWQDLLDTRLAEIAAGFGQASPALGRAMCDAALSRGKRFRAMLLLIAADAAGGVRPAVIDAACSIELVHAASLVFDDLPCMDDARARRGRPAAHLVHGECRAILAGIALVTEALRLLACAREADAETRARLVAILSAALGPAGLSAGQELDLHAPKDAAGVEREQDLKTGALFAAGFEMVGSIQRASPAEVETLVDLGRALGRAFQSYDDLLDVQAAASALGKDTGRDASGRGPARGVLAVRSLPRAYAHYDDLRREVDRLLDSLGFDSAALARHIALVLPAQAGQAA